MEDKPDDMQEATDEEGFPKLEIVMAQPNVNPFPMRRHRLRRNQMSENHENGETTNQRVIVIRRSQKDCVVSQENNAGWPDHLLRRQMTLHFNLIALRNSMPDFRYTHPTCPKGKCAAAPFELRKGRKSLFRIPLEDSLETQPKTQQGGKVIHVSIMTECFFADNIFEAAAMDVHALRKMHHQCFLAGRANSFRNYFPTFCIKVIAILLIILRCVLCQMSIPFLMCYRFHRHTKIHRSCDERGVKPVFTGSACHGPIIYGVRNFCCQYCRAQRQSDVSLKLLEVLNQERRSQLAR